MVARILCRTSMAIEECCSSVVVHYPLSPLRMKKIPPTVLICVIALTGCGERWEGFVYPDKGNLAKHIYIGSYDSLEACRSSARWNIRNLNGSDTADYECGLNCEPIIKGRGLDSTRVCEKTER